MGYSGCCNALMRTAAENSCRRGHSKIGDWELISPNHGSGDRAGL